MSKIIRRRRVLHALIVLSAILMAAAPARADSEGALEHFARAKFGDLTECETKLLRALPQGETAYCGPSQRDDDPSNNPIGAGEWDHGREIRSPMIRWICSDRAAAQLVEPRGIQLLGAKFIGALDLDFVKVPFRIRILHSAFGGPINLMYAEIPELNLNGSRTGTIRAAEVIVPGTIWLGNGFHADGEVDLLRAKIGAELNCGGGEFINPGGFALMAGGIHASDVLLRKGFIAKGEVDLVRANLSDDLICDHGTFMNPSGNAINADGIIATEIMLRRGFKAEGVVKLQRANVAGNIDLVGGSFTELDLRQASASMLRDGEEGWPPQGKLYLDGFVYHGIAEGPADAVTRARWLALQPDFVRQPYEQMAKVFSAVGDDVDSRKILIEMEDQNRIRGSMNDQKWYWRQPAKLWSWILRVTIGYGYAPWRALYWSLGIVVLGATLFRKGKQAGVIVPVTDKAETHYPFSAFWYSLDAFLPIVNLRQNEHWVPRPTTSSRWFGIKYDLFLRRYLWIHTLLGWTLTTLFAAGVTGIVSSGFARINY
jgi:hypothetical protein